MSCAKPLGGAASIAPPGGDGSGTVGVVSSVSGAALVCASAALAAKRVNVARTSVSRVRFCKILSPCGTRGGEKFIHAEHGVEAHPGIPRRVPPQEELQAGTRVGGEGGIFLEPAAEFLLQSRGLREQRARDLISHVRFHIFLLFEAGVEESPGGERVW